MEIRPVTLDEVPMLQALYCNAFKITSEAAGKWMERTDIQTTRAIIEDDRVLSALSILPYEIWMFGRLMPMGGIGGVATFADKQGKGLAGKLIEQSILDMRDLGYAISILYPFSYRFYGRFGYTLCGDHVVYSAKTPDFASLASDEQFVVRAVSLPDDLPRIQEIYNSCAPIWNCMMNRNESRWKRWLDTWSSDRRHVYIIESAGEAVPEGYFCIEDFPLADGGYEARVPEIVLPSENAFPTLARFFGRLPTNIKSVRITMPRSPILWQLFREPIVSTQVHPNFQARIIDVVKACELRGYESDVEVDIVFALEDHHAPWNKGPWRLRVSDGQAEIMPAENPDDALTLTIQEFTTIFTGYQKASDIVQEPGEFVAELEAMDELFYDGETRLLDFF